MCGRYAVVIEEDALARSFGAKLGADVPARYNASPGQSLPVIASQDKSVVRQYRWGFVPDWAKSENDGYKMINARAEGIADKPAFRKAVAQQPCLVLANGFYEWQQHGSGKTDKTGKTPFFIRPTDQPLFAMAGLWNRWVNYATGEEITSFAVITTEANELMRHIHDRMPVLLPQAAARQWLDTTIALPDRLPLLKPYPAHDMEAYEVSREVNKTIHDYPQLLEPVGERLHVQAGAGS